MVSGSRVVILSVKIFRCSEYPKQTHRLNPVDPSMTLSPLALSTESTRMRAKIALLGLATLLTISAPGLQAGDGPVWHENWADAVALAKKENKPLLVDFTGSDWCGWCIKLDKEVFDTPHFKEWAAKKVVLVKLDYPRRKAQPDAIKEQNQKILKQYKIRGFPTILFLDAEGKVLGRSGYKDGGPEGWCKDADTQLAGEGKKE
jgi:protein disulfide-isomerase